MHQNTIQIHFKRRIIVIIIEKMDWGMNITKWLYIFVLYLHNLCYSCFFFFTYNVPGISISEGHGKVIRHGIFQTVEKWKPVRWVFIISWSLKTPTTIAYIFYVCAALLWSYQNYLEYLQSNKNYWTPHCQCTWICSYVIVFLEWNMLQLWHMSRLQLYLTCTWRVDK